MIRSALLALVFAVAPSLAAAQAFDVTLKPVRDTAGQVTGIAVTSSINAAPADGAPLSLSAPVVYAALRGVADRVTDLKVSDAQGDVPLSVSEDAPVPGGFPYFRHWKIARPVSYPVRVSYTSLVQPAGSPQGPPFGIRAVGGGVAGAGSGFLVVPENVRTGGSRLAWDLSGFAPGASAVSSFGEAVAEVPGAPAQLMQGWYIAGPLNRFPATGDSDGFSAAWLGASPFDVAREMAWSAKLYAYLDKSYGYLKPAPRYRVFLRFLDTPPFGGGTALTKSFMFSRAAAPFDPQAQGPREVLAHEMIHQWTGGIEAPQGVSSWFSEGLTTYQSSLIPMRGGFISIGDYARAIDAMTQGYWGSVARDWSAQKIATAGFGDESIRHVPYNRSSLYFADLDARIHEASRGRRRLDDVLAPLFKSREAGVRFDQDAWRGIVTRELGPEAAKAFDDIILDGNMFTPHPNAFGPCFERVEKTYVVGDASVQGYAWVRRPKVADAVCRKW